MNWVKYVNGNYTVFLNTKNGTKIRYNDKEYFDPDRPESMDVKISNDCEHSCPYCHEGSYFGGELAELENVKQFASTIPPYTEIALGGGNLLKNIDHTTACLKIFKEHNAIVSITVRQWDFIHSNKVIKEWYDNKLIYGIGVSLTNAYDERLWNLYYEYKTCILHTIAGILTPDDIASLISHNARVLILGYKQIRRGYNYFSNYESSINFNIDILKQLIPRMIKECEVCSFDNLALQQLNVKSLIDRDTWNTYYMGDDGTTTFYVDLVSMEYAKSSTSLDRKLIINNDCSVMFNAIKDQKRQLVLSIPENINPNKIKMIKYHREEA